MMIKMLLEEGGQFFYCEARKAAPHSFEGIVHFLHKVGDGNAFVRDKSYAVGEKLETRTDALTAAERYGKQIARQRERLPAGVGEQSGYCNGLQSQGRLGGPNLEKAAR
jgi:hypothetical protein